jgi:hypothetical protein
MGIMTEIMMEEAEMDGLIEEAAEKLFITGNYSRNDFNKEQRELIEARAAVMSDDWDAGDYPGWRD